MRLMGSWLACALVLVALVAAGCGAQAPTLAETCLEASPAAVAAALRAAPGHVALSDGTRLSSCVADGRTDGDLQGVGETLTATANRLARRAADDGAAALQLGYLVGAAERGARGAAGIHFELLRRLEHAVGADNAPERHVADYRRGLRAGRDHG